MPLRWPNLSGQLDHKHLEVGVRIFYFLASPPYPFQSQNPCSITPVRPFKWPDDIEVEGYGAAKLNKLFFKN